MNYIMISIQKWFYTDIRQHIANTLGLALNGFFGRILRDVAMTEKIQKFDINLYILMNQYRILVMNNQKITDYIALAETSYADLPGLTSLIKTV